MTEGSEEQATPVSADGDTGDTGNTPLLIYTTGDNVNPPANCLWQHLTPLCRDNSNKYNFKTDNGGYIIRYNDISDTYKV